MTITRKLSNRQRKVFGPPKDEPFVCLTIELIASPAWQAMTITARRIIDFLIVEQGNHGGHENGNLKAPYDQLVASGASRSLIKGAVEELKFLGLVRCEAGGRWYGSNKPSTYRLTFFATVSHPVPWTQVCLMRRA